MSENLGKLLLRIAVGGILLLHGLHKITGGNGFVTSVMTAHGLPAFLASGIYIGEVLAPLALIAGFYARFAALIISLNMLASVFLAHRDLLFVRNDVGGWAIELNALLFAAALASALVGPGEYALRRR